MICCIYKENHKRKEQERMNNYEKSVVEQERNYTVVKSNILVLNSRYQYSVNQQKTLAYICSKIKPITEYSQEPKYQLEYKFEVSEYLQLLGVESSGNQYALVKETLQSLSDKSMWIPIEDENGKGEVLVRWLSNVAIYPKSGKIKTKIDEYLAPYLFELKEKYLSYGLINILNFKSKYSIRLYEMLKAHYDMKRSHYGQKRFETPVVEWTLDLDELKHILMLDTETEKDKYKNFKDFRKKVIETAQKEINALSDMLFDFQPITKGRKTVKVKFIIKFKDTISRLQSNIKNQELFKE